MLCMQAWYVLMLHVYYVSAAFVCVFTCKHVWVSVCIRQGIDGALSLFQHGDKRSLTAREREWQPLYQSCWLITACVWGCVCACLCAKGLGGGIKNKSMSCALYVSSCRRFGPHLLRSFSNFSDHAGSHTCKHTGAQLADTHKQTDASVCHPSLSAWTSPRRTELAKCCCPGTRFSTFQLLPHRNISVEFAFCSSRFSYFSSDLHFVFPPPNYFLPIPFSDPVSLSCRLFTLVQPRASVNLEADAAYPWGIGNSIGENRAFEFSSRYLIMVVNYSSVTAGTQRRGNATR